MQSNHYDACVIMSFQFSFAWIKELYFNGGVNAFGPLRKLDKNRWLPSGYVPFYLCFVQGRGLNSESS